jgi:hypothetical protein
LSDIAFVELNRGSYFAKVSMHGSNSQVGDAELDLAVRWIGGPCGGLRQGEGSRKGQSASDKCETHHALDSFRLRTSGSDCVVLSKPRKIRQSARKAGDRVLTKGD